MEFDENLRKLSREMNGFLHNTSAEEKAKRLEQYFIKSNDKKVAKMLFFLILNTELEIKEKLNNHDAFYCLVDTCPTISLNELCIIITELELINALSDIVSTCPAVISTEILKTLCVMINQNENKYEYYRKLAVALYEKYYKMFYSLHDESDFDSIFSIFLSFLPSSYKSNKNDLKLVFSEISCQLQIWRDCLNSRKIEDFSAFRFSLDDSVVCIPISVELNNPTDKTIEIFSNFLSDFREILEDTRFDDDDSTMKKIICQNANYLYETIKWRNLINLDYENWLESIKRDELSDSDIFTVIDKISNYKTDKKLFKRLINFSNWFEIEEAISCVSNNFKLIDSEDTKTLIDSLRMTILNCEDNLKIMYLDCFRKISIDDQIHYFEKHFEENPNFRFEMTDDELTKMFNKLDWKNRSELIISCVRSPLKTITELCKFTLWDRFTMKDCIEYLKILKMACLSQAEDSNIINEVMKSLILKCDDNPKKLRFFSIWAKKLKELEFLNFKFVKSVILKLMKTELSRKNYVKVTFCLEFLKIFLENISQNEQVILIAFLIRILSHASWDLSTFTIGLADTRELVIEILNDLMKSSNSFNAIQVEWLHQEILKSSPLNQIYFCDFLYPDKKSITSKEIHLQLLAIIHSETKSQFIIDSIAMKLKDKNYSQLKIIFLLALIKLLPVLMRKEWMILFSRLESILTSWSKLGLYPLEKKIEFLVADLLTMTVYCFARDWNYHEDTSSCLEFCITNYGRVIEQNFLVIREIGNEERIDLANNIIFLLTGIKNCKFRLDMTIILAVAFIGLTEPKSGDEVKKQSLLEMKDWFKIHFIPQIIQTDYSD